MPEITASPVTSKDMMSLLDKMFSLDSVLRSFVTGFASINSSL